MPSSFTIWGPRGPSKDADQMGRRCNTVKTCFEVLFNQFGIVAECLGGYATLVKTCSAKRSLGYKGYLKTSFYGLYRGLITAGARSYYQQTHSS